MPDRPLLVTSDPDLLDDLLRVCAAAGAEPRVANDVSAARARWTNAPIVLLGDDLLRAGLAGHLPRREDVLVVSRDVRDADVWNRAAGLGAENVVFLPGAESLLSRRIIAACGELSAPAVTVAVVGGRGGAGASTLSCALALTAAGRGERTMLLDVDPLGGGLDLVLGCEHLPGVRWPDISTVGDEISATALRAALPTVDGVHLLSCGRAHSRPIPADTVRAVLAAVRPVHQVLVVDLPRRLDPAAEAVAMEADLVLLVVPAEVRAVAAAARVSAYVCLLAGDVRVVARGPAPSGLSPAFVADRLGLPLAGQLKPEPGLARSLERGEPPARSGRGPLADLCRALLEDLSRRQRVAI